MSSEDPYNDLPEFKGDTSSCRTCGKCCKSFSCYIPTQVAWRILHLESNMKISHVGVGGGWTRIVFEYPCVFLVENLDPILNKPRYSCTIHEDRDGYEKRPNICKNYPLSFLDEINKNQIDSGILAEAQTCSIIRIAIEEKKKSDFEISKSFTRKK